MWTGDADVMRRLQETDIGQIFSQSTGASLARRLRKMLRLRYGIAGEMFLPRVKDVLQKRLLQVRSRCYY